MKNKINFQTDTDSSVQFVSHSLRTLKYLARAQQKLLFPATPKAKAHQVTKLQNCGNSDYYKEITEINS
jgi:hypothetical protein